MVGIAHHKSKSYFLLYSRSNGKKILEFVLNEYCTQANIFDNVVMGKKPQIIEKETVLIILCPNLNINSRILFIGLEGTLSALSATPAAP
jgi:hypothetical protein